MTPRDILTPYTGQVRVFTRLVDLRRRREWLTLAIVWRLPKWLIYWAVVRAAADASEAMPSKVMGEITVVETLDHMAWPGPAAEGPQGGGMKCPVVLLGHKGPRQPWRRRTELSTISEHPYARMLCQRLLGHDGDHDFRDTHPRKNRLTTANRRPVP